MQEILKDRSHHSAKLKVGQKCKQEHPLGRQLHSRRKMIVAWTRAVTVE